MELGYARHEAHVDADGDIDRALVRGELVATVQVAADDLTPLLEMLPPKLYLLLLRHRLNGD
ncbi:MAG: hypothetical protein ICV64_00585 [Thermoleophilia bacterium]|nr:hypothetical protein [Thermoleophilia bacterium]